MAVIHLQLIERREEIKIVRTGFQSIPYLSFIIILIWLKAIVNTVVLQKSKILQAILLPWKREMKKYGLYDINYITNYVVKLYKETTVIPIDH